MRTLQVYQVDAFTRTAFEGNPAGVIPDARGLGEAAMQAIARELNNSETAFVVQGGRPFDDVSVRFFTPTAEVPICGHATVAAHHVLALEGAPLGKRRQRTAAGSLLVESEMADNALRIWMHQQPGSFEPALSGSTLDHLHTALGIRPDEVAQDGPVQIVSTGHSKVVIPIRRRATIARLQPDMEALSRLSGQIGSNGFFVFTRSEPDPGNLTHGRMFAPAIGIPEDPVTGNASGCLGAYLVHHGLLQTDGNGSASFVAGQGAEVGRPGRVFVEVTRGSADAPINIRIAGEAVVTFQGEMLLP